MAKLESGQVQAADLAGTYRLYSLGIELHGNPHAGGPTPAQISTETDATTLTLRSNGTGSISGQTKRFDLVKGGPAQGGLWSLTNNSSAPFSEPFIWRIENGELVIGGYRIVIGAGGRVLIWGIGSGFVPGGSWSQLGIAFRLP